MARRQTKAEILRIRKSGDKNEENKSNKSRLHLTILILIRVASVRFFRLRTKFI